jgi:hypothetical protein
MRWLMIGLVASCLWLSLTPPTEAQLPVQDVITNTQTSITAVQTTISAVESVIHTAKWIIDQTPLDELAMGGEWAADMADMAALVREAQALGYDISTLSTLIRTMFSVDSAPATTTELQNRLWETRREVSKAHGYALRTQSLIMTAQRTIGHIVKMYEKISELLGNLSGQQNLNQQLTKLVQIETESKVSENAYQLAQSLDRLQDPLILESLYRINEATMASHPR